jgi:hypothetical protein
MFPREPSDTLAELPKPDGFETRIETTTFEPYGASCNFGGPLVGEKHDFWPYEPDPTLILCHQCGVLTEPIRRDR